MRNVVKRSAEVLEIARGKNFREHGYPIDIIDGVIRILVTVSNYDISNNPFYYMLKSEDGPA